MKWIHRRLYRTEINKLFRRARLIDGEKLIEFMIENDVGVATDQSYELKRVDIDFFTEE